VQAGFLATAPASQRFRLGASVLALGFAASATFDILQVVRPRLQQLADRYRAAFSVAGRDGLDMVYLERCSAEAMFEMNLSRGSRLPLVRTTLGWAYLAVLDPSARDKVLAAVRRADPEQWPNVERQAVTVLRDYQRKGYVMRRGLTHPDIIALAVPIVSATDTQVLAINCSAHRRDLAAAQLETEIAPQLKQLARVIGSALSSPMREPQPALSRV
jgi:DNA-binding IclR family transcriptional regulator